VTERAIVATGIGGQGIQLVAKLLAHAAMAEGRQVMMFGVFHGTIRGGASESTVVVADGPILSPPIVPAVWGVIAMHPAGLATIAPKVVAGGVLLANTTLVPSPPAWPGVRVVGVPATGLAEEMGQPLAASMIALGAFVQVTGVVGARALAEAVDAVLPAHRRKHADANRRSIARGAEYLAASPAPAPSAWA
jgi:2-oxoglutarate ferredoxin oxidoreductase subunit gamma